LPWLSVAVQVSVVVPKGKVEPLAGLQVTGRTPSTLSAADALKVNAAPVGPVAVRVAFSGTVTRLSSRVMKAAPGGGMLRRRNEISGGTVRRIRFSGDAGGGSTGTGGCGGPGGKGRGSVLGVVSFTVTVKEAEPVLPWASVAVQVTVVVPSGNIEPLGGAQVTGTTPSTLSVAEAV
jgi:hypothetical protein